MEKNNELNKINEFSEQEIIEQYKKIRVEKQKQGMINKAKEGNIVSRAPFGYKIENKQLILAENYKEIEEIFEEFLSSNLSLRKLAERHKLSVNGLKKILMNFAYVGKVKFNGEIHQGSHQPIISTTLFNHVQNKLKNVLKERE